jgi:hypothetical protein
MKRALQIALGLGLLALGASPLLARRASARPPAASLSSVRESGTRCPPSR